MKRKLFWIGVVVALVLALPAVAMADDDGDGEQDCSHPLAAWLLNQMVPGDPQDPDDLEAACAQLMELRADEIGYGQIMQAWYMSQMLPGLEDTEDAWLELLAMRQGDPEDEDDDMGWGEISHAYNLVGALAEALPEGTDEAKLLADLLQYREGDEVGWGELSHAVSLYTAFAEDHEEFADFGDVVDMATSMGWGEIRDLLELDPGPPPWAGGHKDGDSTTGGPAWGRGKSDSDREERGRPPWAGKGRNKHE